MSNKEKAQQLESDYQALQGLEDAARLAQVNTKLADAIQKVDRKAAEFWKSKGGDINARDDVGKTVLMRLAENKKADLKSVDLVVELGADLSLVNDKKETATQIADRVGNQKLGNHLRKLMKKNQPQQTQPPINTEAENDLPPNNDDLPQEEAETAYAAANFEGEQAPPPTKRSSFVSRFFKHEPKKPAADAPGVSSGDNGILPSDVDPAYTNRKRTSLHSILNSCWGLPWIDEAAYQSIILYANPHSARETKTGFQFLLKDGNKVQWIKPDGRYNDRERIVCSRQKFNEASAAAIVALARLHGWKSLNLQGNVKEREILWLAIQRQNLQDYILYYQGKLEFEKKQKEGAVPEKKEDGSPNTYPEFQPMQAANYEPLADSPILAQWQREFTAFKKHYGIEDKPQTPVATDDSSAKTVNDSQFAGDKAAGQDNGKVANNTQANSNQKPQQPVPA